MPHQQAAAPSPSLRSLAEESRPASTRRRQLVRGWTLASIGVLGGSLSHALAAGHAPAPVVVLLCWALSGLVCTGLAGIRLRAVSTALGLGLAQGLLHAVLALSGHAQVDPAAGTMTTMGHAAHWDHDALTVHADAAACLPGPGMALLHGLVALATFAAVRRGDAALAALGEVVAAVRHTVVLLVQGLRPALPEPAPSALVRTAVPALNSLVRSGPAPTRGPPALPRFA